MKKNLLFKAFLPILLGIQTGISALSSSQSSSINLNLTDEAALRRAIARSLKGQTRAGTKSKNTTNKLTFKKVLQKPVIYNYTVANQQKVDCGFHAVKNSIALYEYLEKKISPIELNQKLMGTTMGNMSMEECKRLIIGKVNSRTIETEEVYNAARLNGFPINNISVLSDLETLALSDTQRKKINRAMPVIQEEYNKLADLIMRLKQDAPVTHAFVLGTMSTAHNIKSGHFIAVTLHKPQGVGKPIYFHMADSIKAKRDNPKYNVYLVNLLQKILQRDPYELNTININDLMVEMRQNMAFANFSSALGNIQNIISIAQRNNMMQNPYFDKDKQEIVQTLVDLSKNHSIKNVAENLLGNILNSKKTTIKTPSFSSKFSSSSAPQQQSSSSSSSSSKSSHTTQQQTSHTIDDLFNTFYNSQHDVQKAKKILQQNRSLANTANQMGIKPLNYIAGMRPKFFNTQSQKDLHNIATMLIENGADINAYDTSGKTPLMSAMETANDAMVALLLQKGADVTLKNNSGRLLINVAFEVAKKQSEKNIEDKLDKMKLYIKSAIWELQKGQ